MNRADLYEKFFAGAADVPNMPVLVEINMLRSEWTDGGVGVPERQVGGAHLTTAHSPEVSASCCLLFFFFVSG